MINYVMKDNEIKKRVKRMKVGNKINTDYQPVEIWIKGNKERKRGEKRKE